jgi:ParB/RepB/Spo0J family partition protein
MDIEEKPIWVNRDRLKPHPANPRLVRREALIQAMSAQMKASGFDIRHAICVRPLPDGYYQITSGHNRDEAAGLAGLPQVPAWVREMDDDQAFMELVLSNTQSELSPLERGMHILAATRKGNHNGTSIDAYARRVGRPQASVHMEARAARVAQICTRVQISSLLDRAKHLAEVHAAPEHCWPMLVDRMIRDEWSVKQTTSTVKSLNEVGAPRGTENLFPLERLQELAAGGRDWKEAVQLGRRAIERARGDIRDVQFAVEEHAAQFEQWLIEHGAIEHKAIAHKAQEITDRQRELREQAQTKAVSRMKEAITLSQWKTLPAAEREALLKVHNPKARLNRQSTDSIEWAGSSWNPLTGCLHNCAYCYARDIAERLYPQGFEPSIVPGALSAPLTMHPPKEAAADPSLKNIFACSMADLFGNWNPREWIEAVLSVMRRAPQWNFLVLTKFPQRMAEFDLPDNVWAGTTVDRQERVPNAERALKAIKARVKWVSIEPMLEPIEMDFSLVQWVVIGGASASSQTPEWQPPRSWVINVTARAHAAGCRVYHKTNLNPDRLREFPGSETTAEPEHAPDVFYTSNVNKEEKPNGLIRISTPPPSSPRE